MKHISLESTTDFEYPVGRYINENLNAIEDYYLKLSEVLKNAEFKDKDVTLCCRGSSGAIIAGILASKLSNNSVKIHHIKKDGEKAHSESYCDHDSIIVIVDDFISTGFTINEIYNQLELPPDRIVDVLLISSTINRVQDRINFVPNYLICKNSI